MSPRPRHERRPPRLPHQRRPTASLAAVAALTCVALHARAETNPYYIGASQTFSHESNLLRLSTGQAVPAGYSLGDNVASTGLLGGFDQSIGRQRVFGSATIRNNRYSNNGLFNNTSYSASTGLDWQTVERLSGSLSASANRSLQRFNTEEFSFQTERNLESVETFNASATLGLVTQYSLELNGGHRQVRNSLQQPAVQSRQFAQDSASLGVRWRPRQGTSVGVALGATQGRYPKFRTDATGQYQADRFRRNDIELSGSIRPTGASSVDATLSSGKTTYDLNQQRNFSGITGSLAWAWQPTGKLRLNTVIARDTGQDSYATAVFNVPATADYSRITTSARTSVSYDFSAKITFTSSLNFYDRGLVRTVDNPFIPLNATGTGRTTFFTLGARWSPARYAQVGCDYSNESLRGSGALISDLRANTFSCFGQITLQ